MQYWLMKSEPDEASIDDLAAAPEQRLPWLGVRNYQARNFMRDAMNVGDQVFFYHSSCALPGIVGIAEICSTAYPDPSQFDAKSPYFVAGADQNAPRWFSRDVRLVRRTRWLGLPELRRHSALSGMRLLARGNRLSITPVTVDEWTFIVEQLLGEKG